MNDPSIPNANPQAEGMTGNQAKSFTRFLPAIARILMGLMFFVFGLNGFLNFMPPPPTLPDPVKAFMSALMATGYMMPMICGTQVLTGALLLINRFVPLALALIAPVVVNIMAFHIFLEPSGLVMALVVLALELGLAWAYRGAFRPMLAMRAKPGAN